MATVNTGSYLTLMDLANMPMNKDVKDMVNMLGQYNPMLSDAPAVPCNRGVHHEHHVVTGLPKAFWGRYYKGTPNSKGTRQQVKDTPGWLESANEVDTRLVDVLEKATEKASLMAQEASLHFEAMAQAAARSLWYQDITDDPASIVGFGPRFNKPTGAQNSTQVLDAGGTSGNLTSIWFITWDPMTTFLIYPKHGKMGIQTKMHENWPATDANGDRYSVYREVFTWHLGLAVKDWRYIVRIANIDTGTLSGGYVSDGTATDEFSDFRGTGASADLIKLMNQAYYQHEGRRNRRGKTCIYANRTILEFLEAQARNLPRNLYLNFSQTANNNSPVLNFRGIPIKESDALLNSEEEAK